METTPLDSLLTPTDINNGVGEWLRYDPVYVAIKDARREEDDGMPRQSWEPELKRANWPEVERLCLDALSTKTKDLQLAVWLMEARLHVHGIEAFLSDMEIFKNFVINFWQDMYPQKTEDPDQEFRTHILEAFLRTTAEIILLKPINELSIFFNQPPTLAKCYQADNLEKKSKTNTVARDAYNIAIANGLVTMERIRNALTEVEKEKGAAKVLLIGSCVNNLKEIENFTDKEMGVNGPSFDEFINNLDELKGLYKLCQKVPLQKTKENKEPKDLATQNDASDGNDDNLANEKNTPGSHAVNDRASVYDAVRKLGDLLITLEPHSPAPALLKLIGAWESKTLSQILVELQSCPPEIRSLLDILARATAQDTAIKTLQQPVQQQPQTAPAGSTDTSQLSSLIP